MSDLDKIIELIDRMLTHQEKMEVRLQKLERSLMNREKKVSLMPGDRELKKDK
jgi:hypothetical protein